MKDKNYWPEAIVLMVVAVVGLIIWTVSTAISNPVDKEVKYMMDYRSVDENYNEIQIAQKEFQKSYLLLYLTNALKEGENSIEFKIINKQSGTNEGNLDIFLYLSKPFGNDLPLELGAAKIEGETYRSNSFEISKKGRYRIIYKIAHNGKTLFFEQDINATF